MVVVQYRTCSTFRELTVHILVDGAVMVVGIAEAEGVSAASEDSSDVGPAVDSDVLVPLGGSVVGRVEDIGTEEATVPDSGGPGGMDLAVVTPGTGRPSTGGVEVEVVCSEVVGLSAVVVVTVVVSGRATVDVKVTTGLEVVTVVLVVGASTDSVVDSVVGDVVVVRSVVWGEGADTVPGELGGVLTVDEAEEVVVVVVVVGSVTLLVVVVMGDVTVGGAGVEGVTLEVAL